MTKRKSLFGFIFAICLMVSSLFMLTACDNDKDPGKQNVHEHTYSEVWSSDETYHWHDATCEHTTEKSDLGQHNDITWVNTATQHWKVCGTCGRELTEKEAHNYQGYLCECGRVSEEAVIEVNSNGTLVYLDSLTTAVVDGLSDGASIRLLKDYEMPATVSVDKDITIDFGGHTITVKDKVDDKGKPISGNGFDLAYRTANKQLRLLNGTLNADGFGVWIQNGGKLTVDANFTIFANYNNKYTNKNAVTIEQANSQLDLYGTAKVNGSTIAVSGNGTVGHGDCTINIMDGAKVQGGEIGIYMPNSGALNIGVAEIEADTALYIKSGVTTINGATLIGKGAKADHTTRFGGCTATGDAIVVDACGYPGGDPTVIINYATISSANAERVGVYQTEGHQANITNNVAELQIKTQTIVLSKEEQ